jgi:integration host factor subunit alpha
MTKAELALILHDKTDITRKDAIAHVEALLDLIKSTLELGEQVKIAGFGVFEVKDKNARRGRNPQTGEAITIDARKVLTSAPAQSCVKRSTNNWQKTTGSSSPTSAVKCWWVSVPETSEKDEFSFLKADVYPGGRTDSVEIKRISPVNRLSIRES